MISRISVGLCALGFRGWGGTMREIKKNDERERKRERE